MEPLGVYHITFPSAAAVSLYRDKLERLLRLAQIKFNSKSGLWTGKFPRVLLEKDKDPHKELERFTILPGSYQARIKTRQTRVQGKMAWQHVIDQIIKDSHIKTVRPQNLSRAHRVIHQIQAGICWVNTWGDSPAEMPVGGYKHFVIHNMSITRKLTYKFQ